MFRLFRSFFQLLLDTFRLHGNGLKPSCQTSSGESHLGTDPVISDCSNHKATYWTEPQSLKTELGNQFIHVSASLAFASHSKKRGAV